MMKTTLTVMIALIAFSGNANAINKEPKPKLCNTMFFADTVIHAKVVKHEFRFYADDPEGAPDDIYTLKVIKTYRGKVFQELVVVSEMGTLNVNLEVGKEYILFPSLDDNGVGKIWDDQGEGGGRLAYSKSGEHKIQAILQKTTASIEGEIRDREWHLLPSVELTIAGNGYMHKLTSDARGNFYAEVKPGSYHVITPEGVIVSTYSPDGQSPDPGALGVYPQTLQAGQCMQIQLIQR